MKTVVLNGSPKGPESITMQSVEFINHRFPGFGMQRIDISRSIKRLECEINYFESVLHDIEHADAVIWAFPVYYFLVPYQYKRFIELVVERGSVASFKDKYAASLSTSVHFFDHAAHNYIHAICDEWGMKYVSYFSADMYDLARKEGRRELVFFASDFMKAVSDNRMVERTFRTPSRQALLPAEWPSKHTIDADGVAILVVTDSMDEKTNAGILSRRFSQFFSQKIDVVDLEHLDIKGGCVGCLKCSFDNRCVYENRDEFTNFYLQDLMKADVIVFVGTIQDYFLSARWKLFFDRSFFKNHVPSLRGKQIAFVISGPLRDLPGTREILRAYAECQGATATDFVTDESADVSGIDQRLYDLAGRLIINAKQHFSRPRTFLSVGGFKVLRDEIWGRLRFVFQADDRFYRMNGMYDFPQKDVRSRIKNAVIIPMTKIRLVRSFLATHICNMMIMPHKKALHAAKRECDNGGCSI